MGNFYTGVIIKNPRFNSAERISDLNFAGTGNSALGYDPYS